MFLGIDVGTSCVKAVVTAETGEVLAQSSSDLTVSRPHPLWSEQAPADWVDAAHKAVLGLDAALRKGVRGIGLAGQMHGATLLGSDDKPLRPA
ncbi:MAG: FGGY family carbohydrate kinase, partial [Novosphingobium sp.]